MVEWIEVDSVPYHCLIDSKLYRVPANELYHVQSGTRTFDLTFEAVHLRLALINGVSVVDTQLIDTDYPANMLLLLKRG